MSQQAEPATMAHAKAKRLRSARMLAGLNRNEIQKKYAIHENTIKLWENPSEHSNGLTEKGAKRFIAALEKEDIKCSTQWLLTGLGEGPRVIYHEDAAQSDIVIPNIEIDQGIAILQEVQFFLDTNKNSSIFLVNDSHMLPLYQTGDYVGGYIRKGKEINQLINTDCILELQDGSKQLGHLLPSAKKGLYNIAQLNVASSNTKPQKIKSAATIIWHRKKDINYENTKNSDINGEKHEQN